MLHQRNLQRKEYQREVWQEYEVDFKAIRALDIFEDKESTVLDCADAFADYTVT